MPSETPQQSQSQSQSQPQTRPALGGHRSTNSITSPTDSPATSPPQQGGKPKTQKHVHHAGGRIHTRVPSNKALHKLTKVHGNEGSHADLKKLGKNASSSTNLKKNSSHVSLKRNRSSVDVTKRPKSSGEGAKRPTSVHFEIGDQDDAWEEASSSASPALSRAPSRSGQPSAKSSANNSRPHSPLATHSQTQSQAQSPASKVQPTNGAPSRSQTADAKVITERLINRTPSSVTTTKMSLATATPAGSSLESPSKSRTSTLNNGEMVSRFIDASGTPSEHSPLPHRPAHIKDDIKRAQSMSNLPRHHSSTEDDSESALKPRSRKSSTTYTNPNTSRTQQKLWLQRASSNAEPAQLSSGVAINGIGLGGATLVGAGYDGRDPRIRLQLERTGLEYLVVRRHQDPVGLALKRLEKLPGAERHRRIPVHKRNGGGSYGLSQSLRERGRGKGGSYEEQSVVGSQDSGVGDRGDDDGVGAILRSMWERPNDMSGSQD